MWFEITSYGIHMQNIKLVNVYPYTKLKTTLSLEDFKTKQVLKGMSTYDSNYALNDQLVGTSLPTLIMFAAYRRTTLPLEDNL